MATARRWTDVLSLDLPERMAATEKTREAILRYAKRFRGGARLAMGRIYTDAEYEERRSRVLGTPLP